MRQTLFLLSLCLLECFGFLTGCSGKRQRAEPPHDPRDLRKLIPYTVRMRRPSVPGADPKVGPGGTDYRSDPLPDAQFNCETPAALFHEIKMDALLTCLQSVKAPVEIYYRLRRVAVPFLELQDGDETPSCIRTLLPLIPVPREILFQSNEQGPLLCYSSRLNIEANELMGFKLPTARLNVHLELPPSHVPQTAKETEMELLTWVLAPFYDKSERLGAKIVPEALCRACLGENAMLKATDAPPVLWP